MTPKLYTTWEVATLDVWGNGGQASAVAVDDNDAAIGPDGDGTETGWRVDTDGPDGMLMDRYYDIREEAEKATEQYNDGEHWNVNNVFRHDDEITITSDASDADILAYLMEHGPLDKTYCKDREITLDGEREDFLLVEDYTDDADGRGKPLLYLYRKGE